MQVADFSADAAFLRIVARLALTFAECAALRQQHRVPAKHLCSRIHSKPYGAHKKHKLQHNNNSSTAASAQQHKLHVMLASTVTWQPAAASSQQL